LPKEASTQIVNAPAPPSVEKKSSPKVEAAENSENDPSQESKIFALAELPTAIQQEIPKMSISGYAYSSTPRERSVGINDRLLQEGDYLTQGLRLEKISPDGLVFSYKKYLFRHDL
jgi:hypothetical protein